MFKRSIGEDHAASMKDKPTDQQNNRTNDLQNKCWKRTYKDAQQNKNIKYHDMI